MAWPFSAGWNCEGIVTRHIAEITCLACGRDLGNVERADNRLRWHPAPESPSTARLERKPGMGLVCSCCGGRAIIGPMERAVTSAA